jgi:hypothetical protein
MNEEFKPDSVRVEHFLNLARQIVGPVNSQLSMGQRQQLVHTIALELSSTEIETDLAAKKELAKQKTINEIQAAAIDKWVPCSGHRDKTVRNLCLLCSIERIQNIAMRAHDAVIKRGAGANRPPDYVQSSLSEIILAADESLGRK